MLLNSNLDMKICDLAMSANLSNAITTQVGNLQFQAPEIHRVMAKDNDDEDSSIGYNGRNADIFSAGVILFLMLTGTYPFLNTKQYTDSTLEKVWQNIKIKTQQNQNSEEQQSPSQTVKKGQIAPFSQEAIDLITQMLQKDPLNRISLAEIIIHPWLFQEQVEKKEITQFMKEKIQTYLKETRTEYRQKKSDQLDKQGSTGNRNSLVYHGFQKFRSDNGNQHEKQILVLGKIDQLQLEQKPKNFKKYTVIQNIINNYMIKSIYLMTKESEIGIHDYEFEAKPDQNCIQEIKSILSYLYSDNNIKNVIVDDKYYKVSFTVQDKDSNEADVKFSIKEKQNENNVYLISLSKNLGLKSLGLNVYQKIKSILQ